VEWQSLDSSCSLPPSVATPGCPNANRSTCSEGALLQFFVVCSLYGKCIGAVKLQSLGLALQVRHRNMFGNSKDHDDGEVEDVSYFGTKLVCVRK
jgi:hypothetical protein